MKEDLERLIKGIDHPVYTHFGLSPETFNRLLKNLKRIVNDEPVDW